MIRLGFGEYQRGKVSFSTQYIKGTYYQYDITVNVDLDHMSYYECFLFYRNLPVLMFVFLKSL